MVTEANNGILLEPRANEAPVQHWCKHFAIAVLPGL